LAPHEKHELGEDMITKEREFEEKLKEEIVFLFPKIEI